MSNGNKEKRKTYKWFGVDLLRPGLLGCPFSFLWVNMCVCFGRLFACRRLWSACLLYSIDGKRITNNNKGKEKKPGKLLRNSVFGGWFMEEHFDWYTVSTFPEPNSYLFLSSTWVEGGCLRPRHGVWQPQCQVAFIAALEPKPSGVSLGSQPR